MINQHFKVDYTYPVYFVEELFHPENSQAKKIFEACGISKGSKLLFVIDEGVSKAHPNLNRDIRNYVAKTDFGIAGVPIIIAGGEVVKNDFGVVTRILEAIDKKGIDRHSYVVGIGGGAVLDVVGFAAAIAHRGVRHIRIPTTVLSQNDSGVGVKNGINFFGKKNFIGTFSPPFAVINDFSFLQTLSDRDFRCGIAEAVKVGLVKDASFFKYIEQNVIALNGRDHDVTKQLIYRCAEIHLKHISSGDPFEQGNSRPLDFGHWSAHKLEQLSRYEIKHGEAVFMGMCLDAVYANLSGLFSKEEMMRVIELPKKLGFEIYCDEMEMKNERDENSLISGLQEFREHLGGELTIMLLEKIGKGIEVHEVDKERMLQAIALLKDFN